MGFITTRDGVRISYKDWGDPMGQPIVFSHGWPLTGDDWNSQMLFLAGHGYRCIAHDRRGHGRSDQPASGNDMDTYADDLAELVKALHVKKAVHVGHSTGGGEVARYIGRHGTKHVAGAVLIGAVPPLMLKTAANPEGTPKSVFDGFREQYLADREQFYREVPVPFYGANRDGAQVSQGLRDWWWYQGVQSGYLNAYECIKAFSETDFTEDLKQFNVPTLFIHGDDDQIVPFKASAAKAVKLVPGAQLKVYEGRCHGICATDKDRVNADLLEFVRGIGSGHRAMAGAGHAS